MCLLLEYSHKKRKNLLETRAETVGLRVYVENQAILELIFPYCLTKCTQTQKQSIRTVYEPTFPHFCEIIISFFSFLVQHMIKPGSSCAIIASDLSQKLNSISHN